MAVFFCMLIATGGAYMYGYQQNYMAPQGFQNPYLERLQSMSQPSPVQITKVNGRNGAQAYQMPPNSSILLLDETAPIVWLRQTDGAGYATVTPYTITPYQVEPEPNYKTLNERISRLEEILNGKSNSASTGTADVPDTNAGSK